MRLPKPGRHNIPGKMIMTDAYTFVSEKLIQFCEKSYYGDCICIFEQSYDGIDWDLMSEFATFNEGFDIVVFNNDWNEGQTWVRNLKILHIEDVKPIVCCKVCLSWEQDVCNPQCGWCNISPNYKVASDCDDYCSRGTRKNEFI